MISEKLIIRYIYFCRIIVLFYFIVNLTLSQTEDIEFDHLTSEDGLSLNTVTKILQDKNGFIWFGTYNGLNRFDGYSFKIFLQDRNNSNSISNHSIWALHEDQFGYIWIGTLNGLNRYDPKTEKFKQYKNDPKDFHSISHNQILSIFEDKDGNIWVGTYNGINRYNRETDNFTVIKKVSSSLNTDSLNIVSSIEEDYIGNLWLGTWNGLSYMKKDGQIIKTYFTQKTGNKIVNNRMIRSLLYDDDNNNLWIGTDGEGLIKYDQIRDIFKVYKTDSNNPFSISHNHIASIYKDNEGNMWIGSFNGLNKYNEKSESFSRYYNNPLKPNSLVDNRIYSITSDLDGIIWVGTAGGVSRFIFSKNPFHFFSNIDFIQKNKLMTDRIYTIYAGKQDELYIGGFDGLEMIDLKSEKFKVIKKDNKNFERQTENFVRSVIESKNGKLWIGTSYHGLFEYDPESGNIKQFIYDSHDTTSISNNGITSILEDKKGNIWVGTWWGFNRYYKETGKFKRYLPNPDKKNTFGHSLIWTIYEDSEGIIWIGTDGGGVNTYHPGEDKITHFTFGGEENQLNNNRVFCIYESKNKIMWFGTNDGLIAYNRINKKYRVYNKKIGLSGNLVNSILEDDNSNIWVGTESGLSKINPQTEEISVISKKDGLLGSEFSQNVAVKTSDGFFYFGYRKGIVYFHPDSIHFRKSNAPIVFTDLKIFNKSVPIEKDGILQQSIFNTESLRIPPDNDVITIDFAFLSYFNTKNHLYKYKLEGFDKDWNNIGSRNSATYTNLPPGEYKFKVAASIGNLNEKEKILRIEIIPAYYQTLWFRIIVIGIILLSVILYAKIRTKAILKQNKLLESKVSERTKDLDKTIKELNQEIASKDKFFSIIAHDLRSPFLALLGFSRYLVDEVDDISKEDLKVVADNILKSAKLTFGLLENLLYWARIKTGRINFEPNKISINSILDEMIELYKSNAENKEIKLKITSDNKIYAFSDPNMVKTILRNLISNAIKFTDRGGEIDIKVEPDDKNILIKVKDTGVGMSQEKINKLFQIDQNISSAGTQNEEGSGLGLILCKEFIHLNKGEIFVKSQKGKGTEFSFTLPKYQEKIS